MKWYQLNEQQTISTIDPSERDEISFQYGDEMFGRIEGAVKYMRQHFMSKVIVVLFHGKPIAKLQVRQNDNVDDIIDNIKDNKLKQLVK